MDGMNPFSTDQWIQQYPNTSVARSGGEPPDASHGTTHQQASPKPIRRRSRASQKSPVTVLNASPTDFRALVQRFTGCDSKDNNAASALAVNLPKGPVNIDFARSDATEISSSRYTNNYDHHQAERVQSLGGWSQLQAAGYGTENANSVIYGSINESSSLMETQRDGGNHGYNV